MLQSSTMGQNHCAAIAYVHKNSMPMYISGYFIIRVIWFLFNPYGHTYISWLVLHKFIVIMRLFVLQGSVFVFWWFLLSASHQNCLRMAISRLQKVLDVIQINLIQCSKILCIICIKYSTVQHINFIMVSKKQTCDQCRWYSTLGTL